MREISIYSPKGGTSKTTLAANLAHAFTLRGKRVLLVDLDRQQGAFDVYAREGLTFQIATAVQRRPVGFDLIIYDHHPSHGAVNLAPIVVCPLQPCRPDLESWAKQQTKFRGRQLILIATQVDYRDPEDRAVCDSMVDDYQALVMRRRPTYRAAANRGLTIYDHLGARRTDAIDEIEGLADTIEGLADA